MSSLAGNCLFFWREECVLSAPSDRAYTGFWQARGCVMLACHSTITACPSLPLNSIAVTNCPMHSNTSLHTPLTSVLLSLCSCRVGKKCLQQSASNGIMYPGSIRSLELSLRTNSLYCLLHHLVTSPWHREAERGFYIDTNCSVSHTFSLCGP